VVSRSLTATYRMGPQRRRHCRGVSTGDAFTPNGVRLLMACRAKSTSNVSSSGIQHSCPVHTLRSPPKERARALSQCARWVTQPDLRALPHKTPDFSGLAQMVCS
jgi:hypothetical protein